MKAQRNWDLIWRVLRQIIEHPETWKQATYSSMCGTKFCIAGHAVVLSGYEFKPGTTAVRAVKGFPGPFLDKWPEGSRLGLIDAHSAGRNLLGLDDEDAYWMFDAGRSLADAVAMFRKWAVEDGVEWPPDFPSRDDAAA